MNRQKWLQSHGRDLTGTCVAITGATGGLGQELCRVLLRFGASLILLDRNPAKSRRLAQELRRQYPDARLHHIPVDLERLDSVRCACRALQAFPVDVLILNAGAYCIPRHETDAGLDNVFQIDAASPYYLVREMLPALRRRPGARVVAVGSIAHRYSPTDPADKDFSGRPQAGLVYGNAKRRLMFSLYELFRQEPSVTLSVVHPGITFTNITAHYPPVLFALIKHPMKWIFMKPADACLCLLCGVFEPCAYHTWIGPRYLDIWGPPVHRQLHSCSPEESRQIGADADDWYRQVKQEEARRDGE